MLYVLDLQSILIIHTDRDEVKSRTGLTCPMRQLFHTFLTYHKDLLMIFKIE